MTHYSRKLLFSTYFRILFAYDLAAPTAVMNFVSAAVKAQTNDARACEGTQQHTP